MFNPALLERLNNELAKSMEGQDSHLHQAMRYSLMAGGKRFRGCVILELGQILELDDSMPVAVAVEYLHAYSLIHDDLPAMDDASLRRGQETCHLKFDEATAILAGDALLTEAFGFISQARMNPVVKCDLITAFVRATGAQGMVQGQMLDMLGEQRRYSIEETDYMQSLKTGALIAFCFKVPGIVKQDAGLAQSLEQAGQLIGRLFQLTDDLLDIRGNSQQTGKDSNADGLKSTLSEEAMRKKIADILEALGELKFEKPLQDFILNIVNYLINRKT